jgi:hypothetical protein
MSKPRIFIAHADKTLSLSGWARETGIPVTVLRWRYFDGWTPERMLTEPPTRKAKVSREAVSQIRSMRGKVDPGVVAAQHGLTRRWVNAIWRGAAWK